MNNKFYAKLDNEEYINKIKMFLEKEGGFIYFNFNNDEELFRINEQFHWLINGIFNKYKERLIMDILDHWVVISVLN